MQTTRPRIAITVGEAAGIGAELLVKIAQINFNAQLIVLADAAQLEKVADLLSLPLTLTPINWFEPVKQHQKGHLWIEPFTFEKAITPGELNPVNAKTTLDILERAGQLALNKSVDAVVTAPVHKANLNQIESNFLGHTEYFAEQASVKQVVMMLANQQLRMTLATTHIPLAKVSQSITIEKLKATIQVLLTDLEKYQKNIKLAVCGLNPHAGESGLLGKEDQQIILPVIQHFQQKNKSVSGPFPADTLFTPENRKKYDVFLAMYHDQGLPVIKTLGFGSCANITLGLPYIRTSVDHGTALDIAADYKASASSLTYAINYAIELTLGHLP